MLSDIQKARIRETLAESGVTPAVWRVGPARRQAAREYIAELQGGETTVRKPVYIGGRIEAPAPRPIDRNRAGVDYLLFTSFQNNTHLHEPTWNALQALAKHYGATILGGRIMYDASQQTRLEKVKRETSREVWFDPRIEPYLADCDLQLAEGLVWLGSANTIPTARNPLSGMEGFGRGSPPRVGVPA